MNRTATSPTARRVRVTSSKTSRLNGVASPGQTLFPRHPTLVTQLEDEALEVVDRSTVRKRRRLDIDRNPLVHLDAVAA